MMKLLIVELELENVVSNDGAKALVGELQAFLDYQTEKMIEADPTGDRTRAYAILRAMQTKIKNALKEAQGNVTRNNGADRGGSPTVRQLWRVRR